MDVCLFTVVVPEPVTDTNTQEVLNKYLYNEQMILFTQGNA